MKDCSGSKLYQIFPHGSSFPCRGSQTCFLLLSGTCAIRRWRPIRSLRSSASQQYTPLGLSYFFAPSAVAGPVPEARMCERIEELRYYELWNLRRGSALRKAPQPRARSVVGWQINRPSRENSPFSCRFFALNSLRARVVLLLWRARSPGNSARRDAYERVHA